MLRSSCAAIVRAAFSETFDVSAARMRIRCSGFEVVRCSPAVIGTAETGRCAR